MSSTWACRQTRLEKSGANGANACTILGGRVRTRHLFWQIAVTSVPYRLRSQMAKVEQGEGRRRPLPRRWMNSGGGSGLYRVTSTGGPIPNERSIYHGRRRCEGRLRLLRRLEGQRLRHHALAGRR